VFELASGEISRFAPLFKSLGGCIPLQGILENRHPARVFVDQIQNPACAFVWDMWGHFYLAGDPNQKKFLPALKGVLENELLPGSQALGQSGFILWTDTLAWESMLPDLLPGRSLIKIYRRTFEFDPATFYEGRYARPAVPSQFSLQTIDANVLRNNPDMAAEILTAWETPEHYLRNGTGICLLNGEMIVSACFSMFIGAGAAEVNVFTREEYRRQGFAILSAAGFIDACLKQGLRPNWECFWDNLPSARLAENLGFKAQTDIPVFYWEESSECVNI
jgi:RimJ/RimL family protein N-acetyltransferase